MFEELNERRKAVERNIAKGFGMDDADLDFEKALEDEFEKGRAKKTFAVGDTFTRHGITYKCTGISANTGRPTWSKVKDGEGGKQEQPEQKSGSGYGKKIPDEQVKSFARILKQVDAMHTDASRYIDEDGMDDEQLANFKVVIDTFKNDQNLNALTRRNIGNWGDLVDEEIKFRKEQKNSKKEEQQPEKKEKREEEKQDCAIEWMEFTLNGGIKKKRKEFDSQDKARSFIDKISKKDSFYQITATSGLDDSKPLYKQSYANTPEGRQQAAMDVLKESGERIKKQMKQKQDEENKALSKELDSVSGFKRMTLHGPGYDYFEISKLSSGVYSLRGYKSQSSSPLLRTYSKKEILDKIKELNLKSSGVKTDPSLTNGL